MKNITYQFFTFYHQHYFSGSFFQLASQYQQVLVTAYYLTPSHPSQTSSGTNQRSLHRQLCLSSLTAIRSAPWWTESSSYVLFCFPSAKPSDRSHHVDPYVKVCTNTCGQFSSHPGHKLIDFRTSESMRGL